MNIARQFDAYLKARGNYLKIKNRGKRLDNLKTAFSSFTSYEEIDCYVTSLKCKRESTRQIVMDFFNFIAESYDIKHDTPLADIKYCDYPFERQLEIAKFLHEPRTLEDIENHFEIDGRTRRADIKELEDGIEVLGSTIQIETHRENQKTSCKSTLHPIFLPLNLTEVYALTVYLERLISKDHDNNAEVMKGIINRIKPQLSDYAINILYPEGTTIDNVNCYINDEDLVRNRGGLLMYLMKRGSVCKFIWNNKEYHGRIVVGEDGSHQIKLTDGTILDANLDDVDFVIDSLDYK